jgi:hypothetical protein
MRPKKKKIEIVENKVENFLIDIEYAVFFSFVGFLYVPLCPFGVFFPKKYKILKKKKEKKDDRNKCFRISIEMTDRITNLKSEEIPFPSVTILCTGYPDTKDSNEQTIDLLRDFVDLRDGPPPTVIFLTPLNRRLEIESAEFRTRGSLRIFSTVGSAFRYMSDCNKAAIRCIIIVYKFDDLSKVDLLEARKTAQIILVENDIAEHYLPHIDYFLFTKNSLSRKHIMLFQKFFDKDYLGQQLVDHQTNSREDPYLLLHAQRHLHMYGYDLRKKAARMEPVNAINAEEMVDTTKYRKLEPLLVDRFSFIRAISMQKVAIVSEHEDEESDLVGEIKCCGCNSIQSVDNITVQNLEACQVKKEMVTKLLTNVAMAIVVVKNFDGSFSDLPKGFDCIFCRNPSQKMRDRFCRELCSGYLPRHTLNSQYNHYLVWSKSYDFPFVFFDDPLRVGHPFPISNYSKNCQLKPFDLNELSSSVVLICGGNRTDRENLLNLIEECRCDKKYYQLRFDREGRVTSFAHNTSHLWSSSTDEIDFFTLTERVLGIDDTDVTTTITDFNSDYWKDRFSKIIRLVGKLRGRLLVIMMVNSISDIPADYFHSIEYIFHRPEKSDDVIEMFDKIPSGIAGNLGLVRDLFREKQVFAVYRKCKGPRFVYRLSVQEATLEEENQPDTEKQESSTFEIEKQYDLAEMHVRLRKVEEWINAHSPIEG